MSIPNTTADPQFIEEEPDWSKPVTVESSWQTAIQSVRDGSEQRARRREHPKHRLAYTVAAMNTQRFAVRRAKSILEQGAPLVVPIWCDPFTALGTAEPGIDTVQLDEDLELARFKAGSYAYFVQAGKVSTFRLLTAVSADNLTLAAGGSETFTPGATVYPCILGFPTDGSTFAAQKLDDTDEQIAVEEL